MAAFHAASDIFAVYRDWIRRNPQPTTEVESLVKFVSYILAGKVSDSPVISELVFSVSNLWVLLNDKIILSGKKEIKSSEHSGARSQVNNIKTWLTVLEYSEVFFEISARKLSGDRVKWIVVTVLHVFKFILRMTLIVKHKTNIIPTPAIAPLDKRKLREQMSSNVSESVPAGFVLKSGRTIRTVDSASTSVRSWKPPELPSSPIHNVKESDQCNLKYQRTGEILYVAKPLIHLSTMYLCGEKSLPPWLLSVVMDVSSLALLNSSAKNTTKDGKTSVNRKEIIELQRRKMALLLYLLRSPIYEKYTKERLNRLLLTLSDSIPLIGLVLRPLAEYLPHWQNTHLYLWST